MAKRKAARKVKGRKTGRKRVAKALSVKRPKARARKIVTRRRRARRTATRARVPRVARVRQLARVPRLNRERRTLAPDDVVQTPPSSLSLDRHGSAVRSGRKEQADNLRKHAGMPVGITGGDVDVDLEDAYFTGEETPGGDNPTPDQDVVDDIGKALGLQYEDSEELRASEKVTDRDKHRWELDPASSEDYKDRK